MAEALLSGLPADPELVADGLPAVSALTRPTDRRVQSVPSGAQVSHGRGKPGQYVDFGRLERTRALPFAQGRAPGGAGGAQPGRAERNDGSKPAVGPGVRLGGVAAQRRRLGVKSGFRYARQREAGRARAPSRPKTRRTGEDMTGKDRQGPARRRSRRALSGARSRTSRWRRRRAGAAGVLRRRRQASRPPYRFSIRPARR